MFTFRYINKNKQPHFISYTLLIENEDKSVFSEVIRIEKCFKLDERFIDEEFLRMEANKEIERILFELKTPVQIPPLDPILEEILDGNPS